MNRTFFKTNINRKKLIANELMYNGDEISNGVHYETYIFDDFIFYFETDEIFTNHISNNGNGDFEWKTRETTLTELSFMLDIEMSDNPDHVENRLYLDAETSSIILKICQEKFYKIEEI